MVIKSSSVMLSPITYLIIGISLIFVQVNSSARTNVIIRGTTTAPNFTRQEGKSNSASKHSMTFFQIQAHGKLLLFDY